MNHIKQIREFVEGGLSPEKLEGIFYTSKELEENLKSVEISGRTSGEGLYIYIAAKNFKKILDLYIIQKALSEYLDLIGESYVFSNKYINLLDTLAVAQPKWLNIPGDYALKMFDEYSSVSESVSIKKWLKDEIKKRFKFSSKPPKWLQDAIWPVKNETPLTFIKQEKTDALHDDGYIYEFVDEKTGLKEVIIQTA
ncbi:hypothetical protein E8K88_17700 [Lampropedia aestuarii]|uniref:Uncharacterized protein n=1 Tax=Lampropedia aestuarii TaxID=2562762 RepID=A0A4V3YW94_9BURK|nr:hypothetical protein [Lampropedia aestuarii]THJ30472.1 hypothetical protein E8K88_17700 [Lampropedia aestuarii]